MHVIVSSGVFHPLGKPPAELTAHAVSNLKSYTSQSGITAIDNFLNLKPPLKFSRSATVCDYLKYVATGQSQISTWSFSGLGKKLPI